MELWQGCCTSGAPPVGKAGPGEESWSRPPATQRERGEDPPPQGAVSTGQGEDRAETALDFPPKVNREPSAGFRAGSAVLQLTLYFFNLCIVIET